VIKYPAAARAAILYLVFTVVLTVTQGWWGLVGLLPAIVWARRALRPPPKQSLPGPLAASGTGRFNIPGWPPSKRPEDYR
jgi:hypothetical protein